jgi:hypothetical protein
MYTVVMLQTLSIHISQHYSFRTNVYALQDLAAEWTDKVRTRMAEAQRSDAVTERLQQVSLHNFKLNLLIMNTPILSVWCSLLAVVLDVAALLTYRASRCNASIQCTVQVAILTAVLPTLLLAVTCLCVCMRVGA